MSELGVGRSDYFDAWPDAYRRSVASCLGAHPFSRQRQSRCRSWVYDEDAGLWYASVAVDSGGVQGSGAVTGSTTTFSFNNVAGNFLLVTGHLYGSSNDISSATYDGVSLASAMTAAVSDNGSHTTAIWKLVAPHTGTHNLVVNTAISNSFIVTVAAFTNVDQVTPLGTPVRDGYSGSGTSHSHTTVGVTGGLIWDAFSIDFGAGTVTLNAGQTTQAAATDDGVQLRALLTSKPGGASVSTGYSWVNDFYRWAHATVPINPSTGRTTKNTRGAPLGTEIGMNWRGAA